MRPRALVFTYHFWKSRQQGGFHHFADSLCEAGFDVDFLTTGIPWFSLLRRSERSVLPIRKLVFGKTFDVHQATLTNIVPLSVTPPLSSRLPKRLVAAVRRRYLPSIEATLRRGPYQLCLVESCAGVLFGKLVKQRYPSAQLIYRPSDPLPHATSEGYLQRAERELISVADRVLLVCEESRQLYHDAYPELRETLGSDRVSILPNGVNVSAYQKRYASPYPSRDRPVVAYIGAIEVDWPLIIAAADYLPHVDFYVVYPKPLPRAHADSVSQRKNLFHIPGVPPEKVPSYVTHCDVYMIPYRKSTLMRGMSPLTGKVLQAMAAGKPIVAQNIPPRSREFGVFVSSDAGQFGRAIADAIDGKQPPRYAVDFESLSWDRIRANFLAQLAHR
jgi:glycosyltransferase involved in cell wall biosynthesis